MPHGALEGRGSAVSLGALVDHGDIFDVNVAIGFAGNTVLKAGFDIAVADAGKTPSAVRKGSSHDAEAHVFLFDVGEQEGVTVPVPPAGNMAFISLSEHALGGGAPQDGCEGFGDRFGVVDHCSLKGVSINFFTVVLKVILTGAHGAERVAFIGINDGDRKSAAVVIAVSDDGFWFGPGEGVGPAGIVKPIAAGEGCFGFVRESQPAGDIAGRLIPDIAVAGEELVTKGLVQRFEVLFDFLPVGFPGMADVATGIFREVGEGSIEFLTVGPTEQCDVFFEVEELDAELVSPIGFLEGDEWLGLHGKRAGGED